MALHRRVGILEMKSPSLLRPFNEMHMRVTASKSYNKTKISQFQHNSNYGAGLASSLAPLPFPASKISTVTTPAFMLMGLPVCLTLP
jgi:hypothetical protein